MGVVCRYEMVITIMTVTHSSWENTHFLFRHYFSHTLLLVRKMTWRTKLYTYIYINIALGTYLLTPIMLNNLITCNVNAFNMFNNQLNFKQNPSVTITFLIKQCIHQHFDSLMNVRMSLSHVGLCFDAKTRIENWNDYYSHITLKFVFIYMCAYMHLCVYV